MWWIVVKYLFFDGLLAWSVCKNYSTLKNEQPGIIDFLYIGLCRHSLILGKQKREKVHLEKKNRRKQMFSLFSVINFEVVENKRMREEDADGLCFNCSIRHLTSWHPALQFNYTFVSI